VEEEIADVEEIVDVEEEIVGAVVVLRPIADTSRATQEAGIVRVMEPQALTLAEALEEDLSSSMLGEDGKIVETRTLHLRISTSSLHHRARLHRISPVRLPAYKETPRFRVRL